MLVPARRRHPDALAGLAMSTRRVARGGGAPLLGKAAIARALLPELDAVGGTCSGMEGGRVGAGDRTGVDGY